MEGGWKSYGQLTHTQINEMRRQLSQDLIIAPFNREQSKGIGYNITATEFVYSVRKRRLLSVYKTGDDTSYVKIPKNDTVLLLSREYVKLSSRLGGSFYSRVKLVSKGLGHISTTLDPGWKGMLLFSINNPMRRSVKLKLDERTEDKLVYNTIATMVLSTLAYQEESEDGTAPGQEAPSGRKERTIDVDPSLDNPAMRMDMLKKLVYEPRRMWFNRRYQRLKGLVSALDEFKPKSNEYMVWLSQVRSLAQEIEEELKPEKKDLSMINKLQVRLKNQGFEEHGEMLNKAKSVYEVSLESEEDLEKKQDSILNAIEMLKRECSYQQLCDEVRQMHELIRNGVPHIWKGGTVKKGIGFVQDNLFLIVFYILAIVGIVLLYQWSSGLPKGSEIALPAIAAVLPPFIAFFLERFRDRGGK